MSEEVLTINFKILGNQNLETIDLPSDSNLDTLRVLVSDYCTIPLEDIRIIYKGHSLKDTDTLHSLGIKSGETLIVVPKRKPATPAPQQQEQQQQNVEQPNQQNQPQNAQENQNQQQNQGNQRSGSGQRRQSRRRRPRILGLGPFPMPMFGNRNRNNNNDNGDNGDADEPPRVEAQQIRELRKQIAKIQQKVSLLNTDLINLQKTITQGHPEEITTKITETKTKITDVIPQLQELSDQFTFDPNGEIFIQEQGNEQQQEAGEQSQEGNSSSQQSQENSEQEETNQNQQQQQQNDQQPVQQQEQQQQPQQQPQSPPENIQVTPQPHPSAQPQRPQIGNLFQSLFGGRQQNLNAQQPPQPLIYTPEELALMESDVALLQSEEYSHPLNDTYTSTDLYSSAL